MSRCKCVVAVLCVSLITSSSSTESTTCDYSYTNSLVAISSPHNTPAKCIYNIIKHHNDICFIDVHFKTFHLDNSADCSQEYFIIGNERLCGNLIGLRRFTFVDESMTLEYRGRADTSKYDISIEQVNCTSFKSEQQTSCMFNSSSTVTEIHSPNYPDPYPLNANCLYRIAKQEFVCSISVTLVKFELEESEECNKDWLSAGEDILCGTQSGRRVYQITNKEEFLLRFKTDSAINKSGFKILIEQHKCTENNEIRSKYLINPAAGADPGAQQCCNRQFNRQHMILASPGLLEMKPTNGIQDCLYVITPVSPNICRIRFHFKHFWVGEEDVYYGCTRGYIEINQARFCGCRDGFEYESYVTGSEVVIYYHSDGSPVRGFIIEVFQQDCSTGTSIFYRTNNTTREQLDPDVEFISPNDTVDRSASRFLVATDSSRCGSGGFTDWLSKIKQFIINTVSYPLCPTIPFWRPQNQYPVIQPNNFPQQPQGPFAPFGQGDQFGNKWLSLFTSTNCLYVDQLEGTITSLGYPGHYPPHSKQCFRFRQIPNSCQVQISMIDFDVEWSIKCIKDYLLFDKKARYCGNSLQATISVLNFRTDGLAYLDFISDAFKFGRGFRAVYRQVPCYSRQL